MAAPLGPFFDAGRAFVESESLKIGQIIHPVRVAITGKAVGFGLFDAMEILGQTACLARLDQALTLIPS